MANVRPSPSPKSNLLEHRFCLILPQPNFGLAKFRPSHTKYPFGHKTQGQVGYRNCPFLNSPSRYVPLGLKGRLYEHVVVGLEPRQETAPSCRKRLTCFNATCCSYHAGWNFLILIPFIAKKFLTDAVFPAPGQGRRFWRLGQLRNPRRTIYGTYANPPGWSLLEEQSSLASRRFQSVRGREVRSF